MVARSVVDHDEVEVAVRLFGEERSDHSGIEVPSPEPNDGAFGDVPVL